MKEKIRLVEVGPRDGLQNESVPISTKDKVSLVLDLFNAGHKEIELTSFVRSDKIPQLSDAKELVQEIKKASKLEHCWVLIPNYVGAQTAVDLGVTNVAFFTSPSEFFNKKNINCSVDESLLRIEKSLELMRVNAKRIRGYLSMVFGCPYEGKISFDKSFKLIERLFKLGIHEISIGDTIGTGSPTDVKTFINLYKKSFDLSKLAMHFHDTRGTALVNVYESFLNGVKSFDVSCGGLGGCPYAVGASGNVATEDVVGFFNSIGVDTDVDIQMISSASEKIFKLINKKSPSKYHQYTLSQMIKK